METQASSNTAMKPTLGLTGVTINAMALIAPGAFLWTTYQRIGNALPSGNGVAFAALLAATVVITLTGTSLSCLNTGVRVAYAMSKDTCTSANC